MHVLPRQAAKVTFPISAMIDCTFLLLIYFMVSCTLHRQEADISFSLPGLAEQSEPLAMPDEQIIEIRPNGAVILNEFELDHPGSAELPELTATLTRYRDVCTANRTAAMLTISAADTVPHQRVVNVLNACAVARVANVTFALAEEDNAF